MLGMIFAMEEEVTPLLKKLENQCTELHAGAAFTSGSLNRSPSVVAKSGLCKVNAALATQIMIDRYEDVEIFMLGLAGAINPELETGDIVVSRDVAYHDVDGTALCFELGEIPYLGVSAFQADSRLIQIAESAANQTLANMRSKSKRRLEILSPRSPRVIVGRILTGDQFINDSTRANTLWRRFGGCCVDMEGAGVAQTAYLNKRPFVVVRVISDKPKEGGEKDFCAFLHRTGPRLLSDLAVNIAKQYRKRPVVVT